MGLIQGQGEENSTQKLLKFYEDDTSSPKNQIFGDFEILGSSKGLNWGRNTRQQHM